MVTAVLEAPTEESIDALLDAEDTVFWVDWRDEEPDIVSACEAILQTGSLSAETIDVPGDPGWEIWVTYRGRRTRMPLTVSSADRHIALVTMNNALRPDYEVRMSKDFSGDTLPFLPLPTRTWAALEKRYGDAVGKRFYVLQDRPNVFTEPLPFRALRQE
jgi:hypothetical protein